MVYHKKNVMRKVCKLVLKEKKFLNADKFSQQKANIIWVGGGGGGEVLCDIWARVSILTQEHLAFTIPCSAAILPL